MMTTTKSEGSCHKSKFTATEGNIKSSAVGGITDHRVATAEK